MKFYRAIHYVHASLNGKYTLCGQLIAPNPNVNAWMWTQVESMTATLKPCANCKKHRDFHRYFEERGHQTKLVSVNRS